VLALAEIPKSVIDYQQLQNALHRKGPADIPNKSFTGPF
jgi:hypothetical protein